MKILLIMIISIVVIWKIMYPDYTYRYRLTIEIDTPEGVKSGSSVIETKRDTWPRWSSHMGSDGRSVSKGEAVFVDLGNGKHVVALLAQGHFAENGRVREWVPRAFFINKIGRNNSSEIARKLSKMTGEERVLTGNLIPTIVTFDDLKNPESINVVYAADVFPTDKPNPETLDNMESKLGTGYKFKSAKFHLTDDAITMNLETHLPWVNSSKECKRAWDEMVSSAGRRIAASPPDIFKTDGLL